MWLYFKHHLIIPIAVVTLFLYGCEKIDVIRILKLDTVNYSDLAARSVNISGKFIDYGNEEIIEYGICWAVFKNPSVNDQKSIIGEHPSDYIFDSEITGLKPGNIYFIRAFASTVDTVIYGKTIVFKTLDLKLPVVITKQVTGITANSASSGGTITDNGNCDITERGVCWGIDTNPTIRDTKTSNGTGAGEYTSQMSDLIPDMTYYVRAYATNEVGTTYGESYSFKSMETK